MGLSPLRDRAFSRRTEISGLSIRASLRPRFEIDSYNQIKKLGMVGLGYGILPQTAVAEEIHQGMLESWKIAAPSAPPHLPQFFQ